MNLEFPDLKGAVCNIWKKIPKILVSKIFESTPKRIFNFFSNSLLCRISIQLYFKSDAIRRLLSAFDIVISAFSAFFGNAENKFS